MEKRFSKVAVSETNNNNIFFNRQLKMYSTKGDIRSPFERDYTRILHANSFRRMKHKTQVFFNV